jgi:hypothetical protein
LLLSQTFADNQLRTSLRLIARWIDHLPDFEFHHLLGTQAPSPELMAAIGELAQEMGQAAC